MSHIDPHTNQCELKFKGSFNYKILKTNYQIDAFINTKKVTKSHIPDTNTPAWVDVLVGQLANKSKIRLKCGGPVSSKDAILQND